MGIQVASEKSMRSEAKLYSGEDNFHIEYTPLTVANGHGTIEIKNEAMAYVTDLR